MTDYAALRGVLIDWYDANRRDLPWRKRRDPYAIWVSEVMLQQTRVETVVPYFERFMARFPTPTALAEADEDDMLAAWSGLGYYRRARFLHAGVREVVARYGGEVPEGAEARRALPGVGRYTAGAIGSIAFGRAEPLVDGNVARVLSRLFGIETPLGQRQTEQQLWTHAEALVRGERPGDLNQGLMELGATLCTKQRPECPRCPWASRCEAHRLGRTAELPVPRRRRAPTHLAVTAVVATSGERVWLVRQTGNLFGGLLAVPTSGGHEPEAAGRALSEHGIRAALNERPAGRLEHVLTHRRMDVLIYRAEDAQAEANAHRRAVMPDELAELGVSKLTRRIVGALLPSRIGRPEPLLLPI